MNVKMLKEILDWVGTILIAVVIAMFINIFIFRPSEIWGYSMEPNLEQGQIGIMSRLHHTFNIKPTYNDIVIIDSRVDRRHTILDDVVDCYKYNIISNKLFHQVNENYWIKRVIGKAGDVLEFKAGKVYRNGTELDEPYIKEPMHYNSDKKITVPSKSIFVMGDNRNNSKDSREIGCVPLTNVLGKFMFKF
jgi:signal peptidase I